LWMIKGGSYEEELYIDNKGTVIRRKTYLKLKLKLKARILSSMGSH